MSQVENAQKASCFADFLLSDNCAKTEKIMPEDLRRLFDKDQESVSFRKIIAKSVRIYPEEERMPLYRYYTDYPLRFPSKKIIEYIENNSPMDPAKAIKPQNFTDLLSADGYNEQELGYCLFPDGSGYVAAYVIRPSNITDEMEQWYREWRRNQSRSAVYGHGNLRYKIANPADLFDCHYVNHKNEKLGTYYRREIGQKEYEIIRHVFSLEGYGVDSKRIDELKREGCPFEGKGYYEIFGEPGTNLCLSIKRPCPMGGTEIRIRKWIGWRPVNGILIRDPLTKCTEDDLKDMLLHILVEREHLYSFLYELYEEYHDLPIDAD